MLRNKLKLELKYEVNIRFETQIWKPGLDLKMKNLEMRSWIPGLNLKKIVWNLEMAISWSTLISPVSVGNLQLYTRSKNVWCGWFLHGNQSNIQNFDPTSLPNLWPIFMGMKQKKIFLKKKIKKTDSKNLVFQNLTAFILQGCVVPHLKAHSGCLDLNG